MREAIQALSERKLFLGRSSLILKSETYFLLIKIQMYERMITRCWVESKSQSHLEICFFSSQQRNAYPLKTQRLFLSIWLTFGTLMTWGLIHTVRYTHLWFCLHFSRCSFCVQTSWVYVVFTYLCSSFSKCVLCIFTCFHHFTFAVVGKGEYLCVRMRFRFVYLCYYVSELFVF